MKKTRKLLFGKTLLIAFVATIITTVLLVFLTGLPSHRSILDNTLLSVSIHGLCFFVFITFGLFTGLNVYDNFSHKLELKWNKSKKSGPDLFIEIPSFDPDIGEGLEEILVGILLWFLFTIAMFVLMFVFSTIVWVSSILLIIAIYWLMIRGLKLVFSKSTECENNFPKSFAYAFGYTVLFVGWLYGIVFVTTLF